MSLCHYLGVSSPKKDLLREVFYLKYIVKKKVTK